MDRFNSRIDTCGPLASSVANSMVLCSSSVFFNDFVYESELKGFFCLHDLFSHNEVHRSSHTHVLDEQVLAALVRQQPESKCCTAHPHTPCRDAKIAGQCQRETCLNGDTVHGRDGQFVELANGSIHALRNGTQAVVRPEMIVVSVTNRPGEGLATELAFW
ncbi:MAG: hypothetical protein Ct9H300mP8_13100 [Gammaproteobacteria bacterium]|nr:MAG: hypothetical protein Ct9H300mP8_13100 [Gammaproteobacteria bacterium]